MADEATVRVEALLAELANEVGVLRAENAQVKRRLARIEGQERLDRAEPSPGGAPIGATDDPGVSAGAQLVSRRSAFKALGAAAAGGVGLAIGANLLEAGPAAAANPDWILNQANSGYAEISGAFVLPLLTLTQSEADNPNPGQAVYGVIGAPSGITGATTFGVVVGDTNSNYAGVVGASTDGYGVFGVAGGIPDSTIAPETGAGVVGAANADDWAGVIGVSSVSDGVLGVSGLGSGIKTKNVAGVRGDCKTDIGVIGSAGKDGIAGVFGVAGGQSGIGAVANTGVLGDTDIVGIPGVTGTSLNGDGVLGVSLNQIGVSAQGGLAPLLLVPATGAAGPPAAGTHSQGEVYVDSSGSFFVCRSGGSPGTWQRLVPAAPGYNNLDASGLGTAGSLNLLIAPIRAFDTTISDPPADPTRSAGPLAAGRSARAFRGGGR
jgi:hypothetical protein